MASLPTILLILAAISTGATVIAALVAFRSQQEARSAIFPIVREEESIKARRALISIFVWIALTALFLGGWLASLRLTPATNPPSIASDIVATNQPTEIVARDLVTATSSPLIQPPSIATNIAAAVTPLTDAPTPPDPLTPTLTSAPPEPPPGDTPIPQPSPTFTATSLPPTDTPTVRPVSPTATPTSIPSTSTPTPTVVAPQFPTASSGTPAPPGVRMGPIQFATEITEDFEAIDPNDTFPDSVKRIYAVFPFRGMKKGLDFTVVWYRNGVELARDEGKWQWGENARSFAFLGLRGKGLYRLELYVNDTVVTTNLFEIQ